MSFVTDTLPRKYHDALVDWQKNHFKDYDYLIKHWSTFYKHQAPFELVAKVGDLKSETIEVGKHQGKPKFTKAAAMDEEMVMKTAAIVKAQASTELGSIQQHRESLYKAQDEKMQFNVLRVMAEEFRHAYQMLYVLCQDDWGTAHGDVARETIEALLGMETGSHVLDAFNVYFDSFVDNITFCAIIDRVGKYQLGMQQVFAYAPMARSMAPMLTEEAFHLATGVNPIRQWAREAADGTGNVSIDNLQRHVNKWIPLGLEMFGDERGGKSNVELGFKDMVNAESQGLYYEEIKTQVVDAANTAILKVRMPKLGAPEAPKIADEILAGGSTRDGVAPEDLLYAPAKSFFRRRGVHAYQMNDVHGDPIRDPRQYLSHLRSALPDSYVTAPDFQTYVKNLSQVLEGKEVTEDSVPFYG